MEDFLSCWASEDRAESMEEREDSSRVWKKLRMKYGGIGG
jgi:hypothetical protein